MEMQMSSQSTERISRRRACMKRLSGMPCTMWTRIWQLGREDPRRTIHALKVGFSLTLVSLLYLMEPLFKGIGQNAIWAVMTVVVVLEFTAGFASFYQSFLFVFWSCYLCNHVSVTNWQIDFSGATLCKGLNRGLGTVLAGSLAFIIEYIANESSQMVRAIFVGSAVFIIGNFLSISISVSFCKFIIIYREKSQNGTKYLTRMFFQHK